jgi:hypothetical protein
MLSLFCALALSADSKSTAPLMEPSTSGAVEKKRDPRRGANRVEHITPEQRPPLGNMMIEIYQCDGEAI